MAHKKDETPVWRPIEVSTERNGMEVAPIEVPIAQAPDGSTRPTPKSGDAAKTKEN